MFALCCMKLGKFTEAEKALQANHKQVWADPDRELYGVC